MALTLSITLIILLTMYKNTFPLIMGNFNLKLVNMPFSTNNLQALYFEPLNV